MPPRPSRILATNAPLPQRCGLPAGPKRPARCTATRASISYPSCRKSSCSLACARKASPCKTWSASAVTTSSNGQECPPKHQQAPREYSRVRCPEKRRNPLPSQAWLTPGSTGIVECYKVYMALDDQPEG